MDKPQDHSGYEPEQTEACQRLLVTLLRNVGPWKDTFTLIGGLVPSLLFADEGHVGTTDVDLVLDLEAIASIEAYRTIEQNLKKLGLERGRNGDGEAQHFRWIREKSGEESATIEFLCPTQDGSKGGQVVPLKTSGQKRLSALGIPGAHLVFDDYVKKTLMADLLDGRGKASVEVRIAGAVSYVVLKALAYEDRVEHKDAYDLIFFLRNHADGPDGVGRLFAQKMAANPTEPLYQQAIKILQERFLDDEQVEGFEKDGPISYGRFVAPDDPEEEAIARQDAVSIIALFLSSIEETEFDSVQ